jgi:hypothetical protein
MRKIPSHALFATVLAGSVLCAVPLMAQSAPHFSPPHPVPAFHGGPVRGAAPGHVFAGPHGGGSFRAGVNGRPTFVLHHDFAHFTPAEHAAWTSGWWHHGQWHGRWGWWWFAGGFWWWYDTPVYPYPTYVSETYYEEPTEDQGGAYWYYCQNPPGYYPYVQYCNGPWQPVAPTPPLGYGPGGPGSDDEQGPPPGYQGGEQSPPPGYQNQGPPPGYNQGPPPGYNQGPPPSNNEGPPPNQ